jgi:Domain of unknown function (DUF309)
MSSKSSKIAALIADCTGDGRYDSHYLGYFKCFNQHLYYEAHDVLEELWLGRGDAAQANFYQGLIQFAGAFVHLQKKRLEPAFRLFTLALKKLEPYPSRYYGLDLEDVRRLCLHYREPVSNQSLVTGKGSTTYYLKFDLKTQSFIRCEIRSIGIFDL